MSALAFRHDFCIWTSSLRKRQFIILSSLSRSVDHRPNDGIYDLTVRAATYDRDNGQFECRMKEGGSGRELHAKAVQLTVLLRPGPPVIRPSPRPGTGAVAATEGRRLNLTCASTGGSPPPQIQWTTLDGRKVDSELIVGKDKDEPTVAVLAMEPSKKDDGSRFKCTVWNRAMAKGEKHEAKTNIDVSCES